jgi:RES domain.
MLNSDEISDLEAQRICFQCVGESYLSEEIKQNGRIEQCFYCHQAAESYAIREMADRLATAFEHHFYRTPDQPHPWQERLLADRESDDQWDRDGYPVADAIEDAAEIPEDAANDVLAVLDDRHCDYELSQMGEETEFSPDSYYDQIGPSDDTWQEEWRTFEQSLKGEARFFNRIAASHLASVFGGVDRLLTADGRPPVVGAGPGLEIGHLYRARVFQSDDKLKEALGRPDLHLGSPPASLASAGRMNARGIAVFYGATEANVAVAEVRPPVGSKVAVARFNITRALRLLDLTTLENVQDGGSIFDPALKRRLERIAFLQSLGKRITRPIMPDDEAFDYLATQAIADFLATENDPLLDGIIFPSAQAKDGRNVVLFQKAARVKTISFPEGTEIEVQSGWQTEEGWEIEYSVTECAPPSPETLAKQEEEGPDVPLFPDVVDLAEASEGDMRASALRIDPKSVAVHQVNWVEYRSTPYKVDRNRYDKHELET